MIRRLVAASVALGLLAGGIGATRAAAPTAASWTDQEHAVAAVGAASADCTAPDLYTATARGRFLSGTYGGTTIDGVAALPGVAVTATGVDVTAVPSSSTPVGTDAYRSSVSAAALGSLGVSAGGVRVPLAFSSVGAYAQVAAAHGSGASAGASGAVTDSGAIDTGGISSGAQPQVGVVDVDAALGTAGRAGALPGLSSTALTIGAVASRTALDGCAIRWGRAAGATARDYEVGALRVDATSAAVRAFGTSEKDASDQVRAAIAAVADDRADLTTTAESDVASATGAALRSAVLASLPAALVSPTIGPATSSSASLTTDPARGAAVIAALSDPADDGTASSTVAPASGRVSLDVGAIAGLHGRPANSALLSSGALATAATRFGAALTTAANRLTTAWSGLSGSIRIDARSAVTVSAGTAAYQVAVRTDSTATTPTTVSVTMSGTGAVQAVADSLRSMVASQLGTAVPATVASTLSGDLAPARAVIAARTADVASARTTASSAGSAEMAGLPVALGLTVNLQPDAAPGPTAPIGTPPGALSTTALRVAIPAGRPDGLVLDLGTSSAGPDRPLAASR